MTSVSEEIKSGAVTHGKNAGLATPCQASVFNTEVFDELFSTTLPDYLKQMGEEWVKVRSTKVSGLMQASEGGPVDDCVRDGVWDPNLQLAHGGPLPFLTCRKGSRGAPEAWPYSKVPKGSSWNFEAHGIYNKVVSTAVAKVATEAVDGERLSAESVSKTDNFAEMDWTTGGAR